MPLCVISGCRNYANKVKKSDGVSYFLIPKNDRRRREWRRFIAACRGDDYYMPNADAVVCSDHFKTDDIVPSPKGRIKLKKTAVPAFQTASYETREENRILIKKFQSFNMDPARYLQMYSFQQAQDVSSEKPPAESIMETRAYVLEEKGSEDAVEDLTATEPATQEAEQHSSDKNVAVQHSFDKNVLTSFINDVFNFEIGKLSDVDKFKRRLIRSIARSMFVDKVPEDEMWAQLRKDTDCDCYGLWKRMRALTLKKLRRLLAAEDRWENITKVARLSVTDWLLFDLVLVHEKVDVIGQESMTEQSQEPRVLHELFELVKEYKIEELKGDQLIRAWVYLTLDYNKRGRQCSPMLLQRRWYQMKELARIKFYKFWFAYGGTASKLEKAWQQKPTELQAEIAKRFKFIVVKEFPSWEELVTKKKIILREEFESLSLEEPVNKKAPDVVIIETPVETIHIDEDSDSDVDGKSEHHSETLLATDISKPDDTKIEICIDNIKKEDLEPDSYGSTGVKILEAMHIPVEQAKIPASEINSDLECTLNNTDNIQDECHDEVLPKITSVTGGVELLDSDEDCDDTLITLPPQMETVQYKKEVVTHSTAETNSCNPEDTFGSTEVPITSSAISMNKGGIAEEKQDYEVQLDDLIILDDGIELEDDGMEQIEEDATEDVTIRNKPLQYSQEENKIDESPKFDYKLLLTPVVYTKKVDDMDVFKFIDYTKVRDLRIIECSLIESKAVKIKKEKIEVTKDVPEQSEFDKEANEKMETAQNTCENNVNSSEYEQDSHRVKYSSWLLQKPKNRSYNPIQLCKNPDFNTRLKRLTAGFLSCEKNRILLKECKRLTIDLHKCFETKMIDGKICLENCKFTNKTENIDPPTEVQTTAVKVSISNIVPIITSTNNKTIMKDITPLENNTVKNFAETCKRNDNLLTVEITPMKDNNISYNPPVEIVADLSIKQLPQGQESLNENQWSNKMNDCETSKSSIEINVDDRHLKDNEYTETVDLEQGGRSVIRRINKHKFQNLLGKTLINGPKNYRFGYSLNSPARVPVAWNAAPKYSKPPSEKDMFGGILLASDTLEKMFQLLSNQTIDDRKKKKKKKSNLMKQSRQNDVNEVLIDKKDENNKVMGNSEVRSILKRPTEKIKNAGSEICANPVILPKKRGRPKNFGPQISHLKGSRYCCWASEKLLTNKIPKEPHYCPQPICICCCRDRLLKKSLHKLNHNDHNTLTDQTTDNSTQTSMVLNKKLMPLSFVQKDNPTLGNPIVLSDDEDEKNMTSQNSEIYANNRCQSVVEVVTSSIEENINDVSNKSEEVSNFTSEISASSASEVYIPNMSADEQTNLESQCDSQQKCIVNIPCKTRGRPIPKISVSSRGSLYQQGLQEQLPQNDPDKYNNEHYNELTDSLENNSTESSMANSIENFTSNPYTPNKYTNTSPDVVFKETTVYNSPSKTPIFLGKNKILLCSNNSVSSSTIGADNIITEGGQTVLPPGVQIVLLPSGELALSIDPDINFTPEAIGKLSEILVAVQVQMNSTEVKNDIEENSEPLNIDDQANLNKETSISESDKNVLLTETTQNKAECTPPIEVPSITSSTDGIINLDTEAVSDVIGEVGKNSSNMQSGIVNVDSAVQPNKKSILSDLMEMSGISENDAICDEKIQVRSHKELLASINLYPSEAITRTEPIKIMNNDQIIPTVAVLEQPIVCQALERRKELSVVSTFAELKDCYEKELQFYKMDTETGQILPINLRIKKKGFLKRKQNVNQSLHPDSVIDLTDDQVVISEEKKEETTSVKSVQSKYRPNESIIKPINLIRSIRSIGSDSKKEIISLELLKTNLSNPDQRSRLVNILKQKKSSIKSKQGKVDQGIDLNRNPNNTVKLNEVSNSKTQGQDSDSDDEPLAQKAKRKRENEVPVSDLHAVSPKMFQVKKNLDSEPTEFSLPDFLEQDNHECNDEDSDDNCILGV